MHNSSEKLSIDLRRKSSSDLVEFLNALLSAKQDLINKGMKIKIKRKVKSHILTPKIPNPA